MAKSQPGLIDQEKVVKKILDNYIKLLFYCDKFWGAVTDKYPHQTSCRAGCSICCELQSICAIEAFVIVQDCKVSESTGTDGQCPFIINNLCSIYKKRPVICRTHGLIFKSSEFLNSYSISCPYNFNDPAFEIDESYIMDIDKVTNNLAHLNLAFCNLIGKTEWSSQRFQLKDLAVCNFPQEFNRIEI